MSLKKDLEQRVRGLILSGAELIVVKELYLFDMLRKIKFNNPDDKPIQVVALNNLDDIATLDEEMMAGYGWVKKKQ